MQGKEHVVEASGPQPGSEGRRGSSHHECCRVPPVLLREEDPADAENQHRPPGDHEIVDEEEPDVRQPERRVYEAEEAEARPPVGGDVQHSQRNEQSGDRHGTVRPGGAPAFACGQHTAGGQEEERGLFAPDREHEDERPQSPTAGSFRVRDDRETDAEQTERQGVTARDVEPETGGLERGAKQSCRRQRKPPPTGRAHGNRDERDERQARARDRHEPQCRDVDAPYSRKRGADDVVERGVRERHPVHRRRLVDRLPIEETLDRLCHVAFGPLQLVLVAPSVGDDPGACENGIDTGRHARSGRDHVDQPGGVPARDRLHGTPSCTLDNRVRTPWRGRLGRGRRARTRVRATSQPSLPASEGAREPFGQLPRGTSATRRPGTPLVIAEPGLIAQGGAAVTVLHRRIRTAGSRTDRPRCGCEPARPDVRSPTIPRRHRRRTGRHVRRGTRARRCAARLRRGRRQRRTNRRR